MVKIKIDMDYCSSPIWIMDEEDSYFLNDDLDSYKEFFSKELMHLLETYRCLWEANTGTKYLTIFDEPSKHHDSFDLITNKIQEIEYECAKLCKQERPDFEVYVSKWNEEKKTYELIEIKG